MLRIFALLLLLPLATGAMSEIYRTTDKDGNVVYTDKPNPDLSTSTESVEIAPTNTSASPEDIPALQAKPTSSPEVIPLSVTITSPANETTIPRGPGNFSVSAETNPALNSGESLQLFIDGAAHGEPQSSGDWQLTNIFRGQHDLTVSRIDDEGEVLTTSDPVRVYVFRPSASFN